MGPPVKARPQELQSVFELVSRAQANANAMIRLTEHMVQEWQAEGKYFKAELDHIQEQISRKRQHEEAQSQEVIVTPEPLQGREAQEADLAAEASRHAEAATGGLLGDATAGEEEAVGAVGTSQFAGVLAEQPFPSEHMPPGPSGPATGYPPAWSSMPPTGYPGGPRGPEAWKMGPPQPMACSGHMPSPHPAMASMGSFSGQSCAAPMRCGDVYAGGFGSSSQVLPSQIPAQHMPPANTYPTAPAMYESQPSASTYCNGATAPGMDHMTSPYTQQYPHSHPMPGEHPYPALQSPPQPHEPTPNQPAPDAAHAYPDLAPPDNFYDSPTFQPTHQPAYDVPP
ncbi:unnamed protein product, partial [Symbiodinium sp. KB8]